MAKPKLTASGKWHLTLYLGRDKDGKEIYKSITADTEKECRQKARKAKKVGLPAERRPEFVDLPRVSDAVDKYIDLCAVLSPTTVSGYEKIRRTAFPHLMDVPICELTPDLIQQAINTEAYREGRRGRISASTVSNEWGLISSALYKCHGLKFDVRLPKKPKHLKDYPDPLEVMRAIIGTKVELPCLLALWLSFSMSEIRGLKFSDIRGDTITINRVIVDVDNCPVIKDTAKTSARIRRHRLPPYLLQLIEEADHSSDFIVPHNWAYISYHFGKVCEANGWEITFHDLRHLNASVMLALNVPEKYAMERGGWSTPHTMRTVYQHTFSRERTRIDDRIDRYFDTALHKIHKKPHNSRLKPLENAMEVRGSNPLRSTKNEEDGNGDNR